MPTKVYKYGVRPPTKNADIVHEQMRLANRYYNCLVVIERERRQAVRDALQECDQRHGIDALQDVVDTLKTQRDEAREEIKRARSKTRSRSDTEDQRKRVKDLTVQIKEACELVKRARRDIRDDEQAKEQMKAADNIARTKTREARAICGVFWGTYLTIEAAIDAARKAPLWQYGKPNDPRFRRFGGRGSVSMQLQGGLAASDVFGDDRRLQIELSPQRKSNSNRSKIRRYGVIRLRVGSSKRDPIWAEWPLLMHRQLPDLSTIKWARIVCDRVANEERWSLQLTIDIPEPVKVSDERKGTVAINPGWRLLDYGVRVGYIVDDCNETDEIVIDPGVLSGLRKVEDLRSIRDRTQNTMMEEFLPWLRSHKNILPAWLTERTKTIGQWKAAARFAALAHVWSVSRFGGDVLGYELLEQWRKQDLHLWQWESFQRRKSIGRRRNQYRRLAKQLAHRYHTLVLDTTNLAEIQRHKSTESEEIEIPAARLQQRDAATAELRSYLAEAFHATGGVVVKVNHKRATRRCHVCGHEGPWNQCDEVVHKCESCGSSWDQDENNCRNLLERLGDGDKITTKRQAKWDRLGRHNKTARKLDDNDVEIQTN